MIDVSGRDIEIARRWWSQVIQIVPSQVSGLWFGLTTLLREGTPTTTLYVSGSAEFDPDDATGDWASDVIWWPEQRYVELPDLGAFGPSDWFQALEYTTNLIGQIVDPTLLAPTVRGVGVGWDDGDARIIWSRSAGSG